MSDNRNALTKRSTDTALMPPPAKRIKRPATVLDEDVYSSALEHIIARDYFPGLLEGEAQDEYLSAVKSKDPVWIRQAGQKMAAAMTPVPGRRRGTSFTPRRTTDQTPLGSTSLSTPMPANTDFEEEVVPHVDVNMSLGAFQAKYTSEDNESFNELLDTQNTRRANKYKHFHARKIANASNEQALIIRNSDGEERQLLAPGRPSQDLDLRPAQVESFPNRQGAKNAFMFEPESIEGHSTTVAIEAELRSNAPPKQTNYNATRFRTDTSKIVPPSPTMSAVDAAIAGQPRLSASSVSYSGAETPRVNGYTFVDAEPTPAELGTPVADEVAEAAEREVFDKLLPKVDSTANPFTIAKRSKREDIHAKLVEEADTARRKPGKMDGLRRLGITPSRTATPSFASAPRTGQLTPAAKQLAAKLATPRRGW